MENEFQDETKEKVKKINKKWVMVVMQRKVHLR